MNHDGTNGHCVGGQREKAMRRSARDWVILFLAFLLMHLPASAFAGQSVSLGWKASPDPRTTGYKLRYGPGTGTYDQVIDVGNVTETIVSNLVEGRTYYFTVFAYGGNSLTSDNSNEVSYEVPSSVLGRSIFYNRSAWDGNDAAANASDDAAVASDKVALLPGGSASFANYTSYSRGINGIMVDIMSLRGTPTAADFSFRTGNHSDPNTWATAPSPSSISVRSGAGAGGSDRVTFIWPDNVIQKSWVQVTVLATEVTGLAGPDVFYFGNAIGDYGGSLTSAAVTSSDALQVLSNVNPLLGPITLLGDFNRDKKVTSADALIALNNLAVGPAALRLINLSGTGTLNRPPPPLNGTELAEANGNQEQVDRSINSQVKLLGVGNLQQGSTHVWFVHEGSAPTRVWHSANIQTGSWTELPTSAVSLLGNGFLQIQVPNDDNRAQDFFKFEFPDESPTRSAER